MLRKPVERLPQSWFVLTDVFTAIDETSPKFLQSCQIIKVVHYLRLPRRLTMHYHSASCNHHTVSTHQLSQPGNKVKLLVIALALIGSFAVVELGVGLFSHSLALLADSGHLASDCLALVLALLASWIAQRHSSGDKLKSENHWVEVLAALINGVGLVAIALWIGWEAIERLQSPPVEILSLPMLATASVGFGVNSVNLVLLHKDSHHDLNIKGAFLHVLADAVSSIGVILAAIAVWALNWIWADGVISLFVSGLIILSATPLVIQSLNTLFANLIRDKKTVASKSSQ